MATNVVRILIACGSGVATSTVAAERVKEIARDVGVDVQTSLCRATDVRATIGTYQPDLVVATTAMPSGIDVPVIPAMGLVTGIGEDGVVDRIAVALKEISGA